MSLPYFQDLVATNRWLAICPEITIAVVALILLVVELVSKRSRTLVPAIAMATQLVLAAILLWQVIYAPREGASVLFGGLLLQDTASDLMRIFMLGCSVLVCHLGTVFLRSRPLASTEFYHVVMLVTAAFMLLVQSNNFLMLFVALETVTIGFYVLVAYARSSVPSLEAGLKYLVLGGMASAIMLFGIVLVYGTAGSPVLPGTAADPFNFQQIAAFVATADNASNPVLLTGAVLIAAGVAFKIGVLPFQIWIPDVYQGAPTPTTAFLAVASKAAGFFIVYLLVTGPFADLGAVMNPLITVVIVATVIFGNVAALGQRNVKRVMGMSGIAHAGVLLLGAASASAVSWGFAAVFAYLVIYAIASFAVFEVMAVLAPEEDADQQLDHYAGLMQNRPFLGTVLITGLGSLAGIPPLAGFVAKFLIFFAAIKAGLYLPLGVALFGVVVSIYYYFGWMRAAVTKPFPSELEQAAAAQPLTLGTRAIMASLTAVTILFGIYQGAFALVF